METELQKALAVPIQPVSSEIQGSLQSARQVSIVPTDVTNKA